MRVSSLSNPRVIDLVSKYFVPSWYSRDFYQREGDHQDERREIARLDAERARRKMPGGNVVVFVVAADGSVLATQPVQLAYKPENLIPLLEKIIAQEKLKPRGKEAIRESAAKPDAIKPKAEDGRIIHVWTRLDTGGERGVSNDLIELTAKEWKAFLPTSAAKVGTSWDLPEATAHKLVQYCYPPSPYWRTSDCQVKKGTLKATLTALSDEAASIKLDGDMELKFPVGKASEGKITAHFVGEARGDLKKQTLASLALVSTKAEYVWYWEKKPQPMKMRIALELEP